MQYSVPTVTDSFFFFNLNHEYLKLSADSPTGTVQLSVAPKYQNRFRLTYCTDFHSTPPDFQTATGIFTDKKNPTRSCYVFQSV